MSEFEKRLACVINASGTISWQTPLQGVAKTNFAATIGSALDEAVAPGLGLGQSPTEMPRSTRSGGHATPIEGAKVSPDDRRNSTVH